MHTEQTQENDFRINVTQPYHIQNIPQHIPQAQGQMSLTIKYVMICCYSTMFRW